MDGDARPARSWSQRAAFPEGGARRDREASATTPSALVHEPGGAMPAMRHATGEQQGQAIGGETGQRILPLQVFR